MVSHDRDLAFGVADRIAVINEGRILTIGTPDEVKRFNDPLVQKFLHADFKREPTIQTFMKNSLETRLGIFVVLAVLRRLVIIETLGGAGIFQRGYHVSAQFDTVQDLKVGDSVKMAGVEIGRVEKITLADSKVKVTMKLHPDAVVKTDSQADHQIRRPDGPEFCCHQLRLAGRAQGGGRRGAGNGNSRILSAIMAKLDKAADWHCKFGATAFPATTSTI